MLVICCSTVRAEDNNLLFSVLSLILYCWCCREFYYIQMEKYARQAVSEGVKSVEDLHVSGDCEIYRVLNLHYNRNNHIEVCGPQVRKKSSYPFHPSPYSLKHCMATMSVPESTDENVIIAALKPALCRTPRLYYLGVLVRFSYESIVLRKKPTSQLVVA